MATYLAEKSMDFLPFRLKVIRTPVGVEMVGKELASRVGLSLAMSAYIHYPFVGGVRCVHHSFVSKDMRGLSHGLSTLSIYKEAAH